MLAYAFMGIGKFAVVMLPWRFTGATEGLLTDENIYAVAILLVTSIYAIKGGMFSVVITEVMQFTILTVTALTIGVRRDRHGLAGDDPRPPSPPAGRTRSSAATSGSTGPASSTR